MVNRVQCPWASNCRPFLCSCEWVNVMPCEALCTDLRYTSASKIILVTLDIRTGTSRYAAEDVLQFLVIIRQFHLPDVYFVRLMSEHTAPFLPSDCLLRVGLQASHAALTLWFGSAKREKPTATEICTHNIRKYHIVKAPLHSISNICTFSTLKTLFVNIRHYPHTDRGFD